MLKEIPFRPLQGPDLREMQIGNMTPTSQKQHHCWLQCITFTDVPPHAKVAAQCRQLCVPCAGFSTVKCQLRCSSTTTHQKRGSATNQFLADATAHTMMVSHHARTIKRRGPLTSQQPSKSASQWQLSQRPAGNATAAVCSPLQAAGPAQNFPHGLA
jgi:hypothetical protein